MKKQVSVLMLTLILLIALVGCTYKGSKSYTNRTNGRLIPTIMSDLYYDPNTKIVYILFNENSLNIEAGYGYMSAYYAPNGLPYIYNAQTNELEEIADMDN